MAEKETTASDLDVETASIISQILSDILDAIISPCQPSTSSSCLPQGTANNFSLPSCSKIQSNEDGTSVSPKQITRKSSVEDFNISREISSNPPFQTCTVKEILHEILDCTVIRRPSLHLPSTSTINDRSVQDSSSPPPEYAIDPGLIPVPIYNLIGSSSSDDSGNSRKQYTLNEVLSEIMDYTVFKKFDRQVNVYDHSKPGTSRTRSDLLERGENLRGYEVYRAGVINSTNAIHDEAYLQKSSSICLRKMLPSYSSVLKMGPAPKLPKVCSSCSYVPRRPPPSYAEVEGVWEDAPSLISSESAVFGPDPTYMICPRCRTAVITDVEVRRSILTHFVAIFLCLCLCWPCCLMPYCLRSCNYSHHSCPNCSYYFGMYRPF